MNNTQYEEYKMPKLMYLPLQGEDAMTEVDSGLENGDLFVLNGLMTERGKTCVSNLFHVMVASNFFYQPVKQEFMSLYILLISHITEIIMSLSYFDWYSQIFISHVAVFC